MKRFITVLSSLLVLPAFAEIAPVYYDDVIEYSDDMINDEETVTEEAQAPVKNVAPKNTINRSTATSRAISSATASNTSRSNVSSRAIATSPRSTTGTARGTASRTAKTNAVISRNQKNTRTSVTARGSQVAKPVTARISTGVNSVIPGNKYSSNYAQSELGDAGKPLYNANSARVGVSNRRTTARISTATTTASTGTPIVTEEDVSATTKNLTAIAELTDYCKAQYAACMDNYCNVLDDNQGRCSCSKNLKNYEKTEAALAEATEKFQEAVQKIKYIGLTGPQIEALFAETEAEISMKSNSDSSRLKNSLDTIKKSIVDVSGPSSGTSSITSGISLDLNGLLNADFTGGFDLSSFLGGTGTTTSNVSNQRGEQLYKTATNRCRTTVLNSCTSQGIDANVITNSYDLEIDKQCMAYERSLNEANTEMRNNVSNATNILQQARLLLTQNKNSYDFRGCVAAIDSCMQDEYVCGSDYELCLDPTGKYLANGEIVKGGTPGISGGQVVTKDTYDPTAANSNWNSNGMYHLYSVWNYTDATAQKTKNAWSVGSEEDLGGYIDAALNTWKTAYNKTTTNTDNMALYLLQKIGYIDSKDNEKVHGMCASVMKQCQDYTFDSQKTNKKYLPSNEVVRQYLASTLAKIKAKQDAILSDYAEDCRSDVQSCLSTNGYDESNTDSTASKTAVNACSSEITTCMSVGGYQVADGVRLTLRAMTDWVSSILINCPANTYLVDDGIGYYNNVSGESSIPTGTAVSCKSCGYPKVVDANGEIIPETFTENPATSSGGQIRMCTCPDGYTDYIIYVEGDDGETKELGCQKVTTSGN